jgi:predicted dehydrogenase
MSTEAMHCEIGVGLISVGWMGRLHTRAYKAVAEHFPELGLRARLVIAADTVEASARQASEVLGYQSWSLDYNDVLSHPDVDVVSICAPNFLHKEMALAAAKAGKPFWIEKPMGRGAMESGEIARAAQDAGIVTGVGFNYRYVPALQHARALIRGGRLGRVTNIRCWLLADYSADPSGALTWRFEKERAGSGVLGDLASHGFDLAQFLAGEITDVTALTQTIIAERLPAGRRSGEPFQPWCRWRAQTAGERGIRRCPRTIRFRRGRYFRIQPRGGWPSR